MKLHLLLTHEIAQTRPETCKMILDWGPLMVRFDDGKDYYGTHCVVEDTEENIINWLKPFDGFVKGNGNPMSEQFHIVHIK